MKKLLFLLLSVMVLFASSCTDKAKDVSESEPSWVTPSEELIFEVPGYGSALLKSYAVTEEENGEILYLSFEYTNDTERNSSFSNLSLHFDVYQGEERANEITASLSKDDWTVIAPGESIESVIAYKLYDTKTDIEFFCKDALDMETFGMYTIKP